MAVFTVSISDGTTLSSLAVSAGRGPQGPGWTGVSYDTETGRFTFTSNDGLGYTSDDITVGLDAAVAAAEAAQAAAEAAETNTINLFDQFGDQYLGPKASDPTTDNDGDPLTDGDIYFNTTDNVLKFYSGTAWVAPEVIATTAASDAQTAQAAAEAAQSAAETSETNAAASASAASTSETNAAASASAAATSETNAATSETNAANSASAAATSETNAATSETNAASSASAAATSETNAATSETNAANSASAAATSETNAATSETNAAASASAAATSEANAAASFDSFDDRYLGSKASAPTLDNDGNALLTGALYWNSTSDQLFIWDGSSWASASFSDVNPSFDSITANTADINGNITVTGTVDGRDVAADGSKLDGIEAGADVTDTANVTAAGALMDSELTSEASVKALDQGVATTDSPDFAGLTVDTDTLYVDSANNRVGIGTSSPDYALDVAGTVTGEAAINLLDNRDGGGPVRIDSVRGSNTPGDTAGAMRFYVSDNSNPTGKEAMRIDSNGRVGIGAISPSATLDVNGSLSKNSGSFKIDHPVKPDTHHLVHSFVEGPQADNLYRGKVTLVEGFATVDLDEAGRMTEGTFVALNGNVQCWTTNEDGWTQVRGKVEGNTLTIEARDPACTDEVSWLVIGERHDQHMMDTEWTDENGCVITEPAKENTQ